MLNFLWIVVPDGKYFILVSSDCIIYIYFFIAVINIATSITFIPTTIIRNSSNSNDSGRNTSNRSSNIDDSNKETFVYKYYLFSQVQMISVRLNKFLALVEYVGLISFTGTVRSIWFKVEISIVGNENTRGWFHVMKHNVSKRMVQRWKQSNIYISLCVYFVSEITWKCNMKK